MKISRWFARIVALGTLGAFVATLTPARSAGEPLEIPTVLPMTGQVALIGSSVAKALGVLENEVNAAGGIDGRPVKFAISDDQSNPAVTVQLVSRIIAAKAPLMLGPNLGGSCNASVPLVKDGPVMLCFSPGIHPDPGSFAFSASASTSDIATLTARYAKRRGWKKIAFIVTTDQSGNDGEHSLGQAFAAQAPDTKIIDIEHFNPSDISVAAQVARIKAAAPDAIDAWASGTPSATALRAISDAGINVPVITSYSNSTAAQMAAFKDYMPKELLMAGPPAIVPPGELARGPLRDAVSKFYRSMEAAGGHPDVLQTTAWDSAQIAVAALRKLGPNATAAQVRDYIDNLKGFTGVTGTFDFRAVPQRGVDWRTALLMARWDPAKGTFVRVSPIGG